jgi:hypothetical protein
VLEEIRGTFHRINGLRPNFQTGPEKLTPVWSAREDVRTFPPATFYPVGWWEKGLLGNRPYPAESYCVHHWRAGWKKTSGQIPR